MLDNMSKNQPTLLRQDVIVNDEGAHKKEPAYAVD